MVRADFSEIPKKSASNVINDLKPKLMAGRDRKEKQPVLPVSKMPIFRRGGMRDGGKPLPLAFQYLMFMI